MYYGSLDEMLIWKESIISINQFTKESNMNSIYSTFGIYRITNMGKRISQLCAEPNW